MGSRRMGSKANIAWADEGKTIHDEDGDGDEAGENASGPSLFQRMFQRTSSMFSRKSSGKSSAGSDLEKLKRRRSSLSMINREASNATEAINATVPLSPPPHLSASAR